MLYRLLGFLPHSSSDPLKRATFPPGEGFWQKSISLQKNRRSFLRRFAFFTFPESGRSFRRCAEP